MKKLFKGVFMKSLMCISAVLVLMIQAQAQDTLIIRPTPRFEIGALLGEPIGLSLKFWHGTITATDLSAAWSFTENGTFEMHIDLLIHPLTLAVITKWETIFHCIIVQGWCQVGDDWFFGSKSTNWVEYLFILFLCQFLGKSLPNGSLYLRMILCSVVE